MLDANQIVKEIQTLIELTKEKHRSEFSILNILIEVLVAHINDEINNI